LGIIPLAAGVVTALRTSAKNSVRKLIDYTTYVGLRFSTGVVQVMTYKVQYVRVCGSVQVCLL